MLSFSVETPATVTNIKLQSIGVHGIDISWDSLPVYQSVAELIGYKIIYHHVTDQGELDEQTNVTITVDRSTTNYRMAGLERNAMYCVRILAYDEYGDGEIGNCTEAKTATGNVICSHFKKERKVCLVI